MQKGLLSRSSKEPKRNLKYVLDVGSIVAQLLGFFVWPLANPDQNLWFIPLALLLISFHWWENYVSTMSPLSKFYFEFSNYNNHDNFNL